MPTPVPGKASITVRMDDHIREELEGYAEKFDVSVNWLIVRAIKEFLTSLPPLQEAVLKLTKE